MNNTYFFPSEFVGAIEAPASHGSAISSPPAFLATPIPYDYASYPSLEMPTAYPSPVSVDLSLCPSPYLGGAQMPGIPPVHYGVPSRRSVEFSQSTPTRPFMQRSPPAVATPTHFNFGLPSPSPPQPPQPMPVAVSTRPTSKTFPCPKCQRTFSRNADVKRHVSSVHQPVNIDCPAENCSRKGKLGFPRKDHLVEHLRSYHQWKIPKRGSANGGAKRVNKHQKH